MRASLLALFILCLVGCDRSQDFLQRRAVLSPPILTSVSPSLFASSSDTKFTLRGKNFPVGKQVTVRVGGFSCDSAVVVSESEITCLGATSVADQISSIQLASTLDALVNSLVNFEVESSDGQKTDLNVEISYILPPHIQTVSKKFLSLSGEEISLYGNRLSSLQAIKVDGLPCESLEVISNLEAKCIAPAHSAGTANIVAMDQFEQFSFLKDAVQYQPAKIQVVTAPIQFQPLLVGETSTSTLKISNQGATTASLIQFAKMNKNFSLAPYSCLELKKEEECALTLIFTPAEEIPENSLYDMQLTYFDGEKKSALSTTLSATSYRSPQMAFSPSLADSFVNSNTTNAFPLSGTCTEENQSIVIEGSLSQTTQCHNKNWSSVVDLSAIPDGKVTLSGVHVNRYGYRSLPVSLNLSKKTNAISVSFEQIPEVVNIQNVSSYTLKGFCSENDLQILITGAADKSTICNNGTWSINLILNLVSDGMLHFQAVAKDVAGNSSTAVSKNVQKDTQAPTLSILTPAEGSYVNLGNLSNLILSGTCSEEGQTISISANSNIHASALCSGGIWNKQMDLSAAPEGAVVFTIEMTDAAGNKSIQLRRNLIKDTIKPVLDFISPIAGASISTANVSSFLVSGSCSENGQLVKLTGAASASTSCSSNLWSVTLNLSSVADGSVVLKADLSDAAGNIATQVTRSFIKDVALPTVAFTSPAANSYINGTNVSSFLVTGSCSENGQFVKLTGAATASTSCSSNVWSATLNLSSIADGAVVLKADLSDAAGNVATQVTRSFIKDVAFPTVAFTSPAANSYINATNVSSFVISGSCSENGQLVKISGAVTSSTSCASNVWSATINLSSVVDGAVSLKADLSDAAGNVATQVTRSFIKDVAFPTVAFTSPAANSYINATNVSSFVISGSCSENGQLVKLTGGASASTSCSSNLWSATLNLSSVADGAVVFKADLSDAAGNVATQVTRSFIKDVVQPTVAFTSPAANSYINATNVSSFLVSGSCSENGQLVKLTGGASASTSCSSNVWSATLNLSSVVDGSVVLKADLSDSAGNVASQVSRSFVKDVGLPTVAFTSPVVNSFISSSNVSAFTVSGSCSENGRLVQISGAASASSTCSSNVWSATLNLSSVADGPVVLKADLSDSAGNSASQVSQSYVKDVGQPIVAFTSPAANSYISAANVSSFLVSGSCSENGQIVRLTGAATVSTSCSSNVWSVTLNLSSVVDGAVVLKADLSDSAGNLATQVTRSFIKDVALPTVAFTSPAANSYINAANVSSFIVSGSCSENGQLVKLTGAATASTSCSSNIWSATLNLLSIADGAVVLKADLSDAAGNVATQVTRSFIKDVVQPTVAFTSPAANSYINATNVSSFLVSGSCSENGQLVKLTGAATVSTSCSSNFWSVTLNLSSVADGSVVLKADLSDAAGNVATQVTRSFIKDVVQPTVAFTSPAANSYINVANVSSFIVNGSCSENGQLVKLTGAATATTSCSSNVWSATLNLSSVADGAVLLKADLSDAAGNVATQVTRSFIKDVAFPTVAFTSPAANSYINATNVSSFVISGSCSENGQLVKLTGGASASTSCSSNLWSVTLNLSSVVDGAVVFKADLSDAAGNVATQVTRSFIKDVVQPTVTFTSPAANSYINAANVSSFIVNGSCTENGQVVNLSGAAAASVPCTSNVWSATLNLSSVADGAVLLKADLSDAAGNVATQVTRSFIKDTIAPTVTMNLSSNIVNAANKANYMLMGTCSELTSLSVVANDTISISANCSVSHTWSTAFDLSSLQDGRITIKVSQVDTAGNVTLVSNSGITKDTVSPLLTLTSPLNNSFQKVSTNLIATGTCSEIGRNVAMSGSFTASTVCTPSKTWSLQLDSSAAEAIQSITLSHSDAAGNTTDVNSQFVAYKKFQIPFTQAVYYCSNNFPYMPTNSLIPNELRFALNITNSSTAIKHITVKGNLNYQTWSDLNDRTSYVRISENFSQNITLDAAGLPTATSNLSYQNNSFATGCHGGAYFNGIIESDEDLIGVLTISGSATVPMEISPNVGGYKSPVSFLVSSKTLQEQYLSRSYTHKATKAFNVYNAITSDSAQVIPQYLQTGVSFYNPSPFPNTFSWTVTMTYPDWDSTLGTSVTRTDRVNSSITIAPGENRVFSHPSSFTPFSTVTTPNASTEIAVTLNPASQGPLYVSGIILTTDNLRLISGNLVRSTVQVPVTVNNGAGM